LNRSAEEIAKEVNSLLLQDEATSSRLQEIIDARKPRPRRQQIDDDIPF